MNNWTKRLRVFAGPNGSGKSTLYDYLIKIRVFNSYFHINPDSIARDLPVSLNLDNWPISFSEAELSRFLDNSPFQSLVSFQLFGRISVHNRILKLSEGEAAGDISYLAAAIADYLRHKMLQADSSFSFESVFSHPSKIKEITEARRRGFKIYLYFISTADPLINQQRVRNRVGCGGHDVPEVKVRERYFRTMANCYDAFLLADRVFFFDNSVFYDHKRSPGPVGSDGDFPLEAYHFFAEKRSDKIYISNSQSTPQWFDEYILRKLPQ